MEPYINNAMKLISGHEFSIIHVDKTADKVIGIIKIKNIEYWIVWNTRGWVQTYSDKLGLVDRPGMFDIISTKNNMNFKIS